MSPEVLQPHNNIYYILRTFSIEKINVRELQIPILWLCQITNAGVKCVSVVLTA